MCTHYTGPNQCKFKVCRCVLKWQQEQTLDVFVWNKFLKLKASFDVTYSRDDDLKSNWKFYDVFIS